MSSFIRERVMPGDFAVTFTVQGSGEFPFDMLRYDGCYPSTERDDVPAIAVRPSDGSWQKLRRVVLIARPLKGEKNVTLTPARWASFGWRFVGFGELRDATTHPVMPNPDFYYRA